MTPRTLGVLSAWGQAIPCADPEAAISVVIGMEVAGNGAKAPGFAENWREDSQWLNSVRWTASSIGGERAI